MIRAVLLFTLFWLAGCSIDRQYERYPNLTKLEDITLTEDNHPHGYGRSDCFSCHVSVNIHRVDYVQSGLLNTAQRLTETYGIDSCRGCHQSNGVAP
ncbi:MAG TPA: hypothetical protein VJB59_08325 [Bdellovibrionota bacterium]|nr:hypothetical protein [Bdellovibrionota bacterium]